MFSVIIPTYQRRDLVVRTITSIAKQTLPMDRFAVVVVVDGSTDGTLEALQSLDVPYGLRVVTQENRGLGAARNTGISEADGDWLVFLDDDMVLEDVFLERIADAAVADCDIVLPRVSLGDWVPDTVLSREARGWDLDAHEAMTSGTFRLYDVIHRASAVRRALVAEIGGFEEEWTAAGMWGNEDIEFSYRLLTAGAVVCYQPEARARTDCILDPHVWLRRHREVGRSDVAMVKRHPGLVDEVWGRLLRRSRVHKAVARAILAAPPTAQLAVPIRPLVAGLVARGHTAWWVDRAWFTVRAAEYWRAVVQAGGRTVAREVLRRTSHLESKAR